MGPTASGKTDLAIALTKFLPCDVISVDSAMVYQGMNIGTAKPSANELLQAPHRLINLCKPTEVYSVGDFCAAASQEIDQIVKKGRVPLLVGGTMMYFNALQNGLAVLPKGNQEVRACIEAQAAETGWPTLHDKLAKIDPVAAAKIKPTDAQRISRALEVYQLTGKPLSDFHETSHQAVLSDYKIINMALIPQDRSWLHGRIALRFQKMLAAGFIDEVKTFYNDPRMNRDLPAMRMVGYRQVWGYLAGEYSYDEMIERGIAATRQLAKRQLTWLRSNWKNLIKLDPQDRGLLQKACQAVALGGAKS